METNGNSSRQQGTVKWFNSDKGFGFIERPGDKDVFVHFSELRGFGKNERRNLAEGQKVEFELVSDPKGPKAVEVRVIG